MGRGGVRRGERKKERTGKEGEVMKGARLLSVPYSQDSLGRHQEEAACPCGDVTALGGSQPANYSKRQQM